MDILDVCGYPLGVAYEKLRESGIQDYHIKITSAPHRKADSYDDSFRVVRCVRDIDGSIEVLVCKPL